MNIRLQINDALHEVDVSPGETLLSVLRDTLNLTGTKYGCGEGQCGACTVLIGGVPVKSCQRRAAQLGGQAITTIEGLERDGRLHPVQEAFLKHEAMQCGFCTSGMIMAAVGLVANSPSPTEPAVVKAMNGNICRCGTHPRIIAAIRDAAGARQA